MHASYKPFLSASQRNLLAPHKVHFDKSPLHSVQSANPAPAQRLQLPDLDGRTVRVELTVLRPNPEATAYAANDVFLYVGIQEELSPGRKAAIHRINSGSKGWPQANQDLGLQNDQFVKITVDLKVKAKEMRGDAFFVIGIERKSPPGGQIYVDGISVKLLDR